MAPRIDVRKNPKADKLLVKKDAYLFHYDRTAVYPRGAVPLFLGQEAQLNLSIDIPHICFVIVSYETVKFTSRIANAKRNGSGDEYICNSNFVLAYMFGLRVYKIESRRGKWKHF